MSDPNDNPQRDAIHRTASVASKAWLVGALGIGAVLAVLAIAATTMQSPVTNATPAPANTTAPPSSTTGVGTK